MKFRFKDMKQLAGDTKNKIWQGKKKQNIKTGFRKPKCPPRGEWIKQNVICPYNEIVLSNKKKKTNC